MSDYLHEYIEEFRLVDVDGIVLDSPGDELVIREPSGFNEIDISLMRDRDYHGFSFEFSDPNKKYGFDFNVADGETLSSRELLQQVFDSKGSNGNVLFEYYIQDVNGVLQKQISAKIEFETYSRKHEVIEFATSRDNLASTINNRFDTKINFNDTLDLDGGDLPTFASVNVYTHSLLFEIVGKLDNAESEIFNRPGEVYYPGPSLSDEARFQSLNILNLPVPETRGELEMFGYQGQVLFDNGEEAREFDGLFVFNAPDDGEYNIDYRSSISVINSQFNLRFNNGGTTGSTGEIRFYYKINERGTPVEFATVAGVNTTPNDGISANSYEYVLDTTTWNDDIALKKGDNFYIYYEYFHDEQDGASQQRLRSLDVLVASNLVNFESTYPGLLYGFITVTAKTSFVETSTPSYYYFESINRVLSAITGLSNVLDSPFFDRVDLGAASDGPGAYNVFTNGFLLRQFANDKGLRISMKDIVEHVQAVFGLGFQVGTSQVLFQRYQDFYQDKLIMNLTDVYDITRRFDDTYSFSKINIGYKTYIEGDENDRVNTLDEFHTEHEYYAPLGSIKKDLTLISPITMSGYAIEITRRQSFSDEETSSWKYDDNVFGIAVLEYDGSLAIGTDFSFATATQPSEGDGYFILNGGGFKFFTEETSIIFVGNAFAGTYTITAVELKINPASGLYSTFVYVSDDLTSIDGTLVNTGSITLSQTYIVSEKDEPFANIAGVISPSTVYNARHNIKYMLFNQAPLINSGLNYNDGTELVKNQNFVNNGDAKFQFNIGEGANTLDPDRSYFEQKANLQINDINQFQRLFIPVEISFKVPLKYSDIDYIKQALLNENADDVNFGYIAFNDEFGVETKVFINELNYNPRTAIAEIVGVVKYEP